MNTEQLISSLSAAHRPILRLTVRRLAMECLLVSCITLTLNLALSGLRPDWPQRITDTSFIADLTSLGLLALCSAIAAIRFAYPDRAHERWPYLLFWIALALQIIAAFSQLWQLPGHHGDVSSTEHTLECLACVLMVALLPAGWLWWRLRQLAPVRPTRMALCAATMALALGSIGVLTVEDHLSSEGLLLWHYGPLWAFAVLGFFSGRRLFRW